MEQLVPERGVGGNQGDEGPYQVSLRDPAAEQSANVDGELVEASGGVGVEQDGELAGWGHFGDLGDLHLLAHQLQPDLALRNGNRNRFARLPTRSVPRPVSNMIIYS